MTSFPALDDLHRHARERPEAPALVTPSRTYSFAELEAAVLAVSGRLAAGGIRPGDLVALDLPTALEWIVDLALFRLAVRTVSIRLVGPVPSMPLAAVVTEPSRAAPVAPLRIDVDGAWVDEAVADGTYAVTASLFDEGVFRYILTSGTTGTPRVAAYSTAALRYRMAGGSEHWTDGRPELTLIGLSTTGGFHAALACLQYGIPYLAVDHVDEATVRFAAASGIEVLCGSPGQIGYFLAIAEDTGVRFESLQEVRLAAAGPSVALLRRIIDTWGVRVRGVYGSTEGGGVSQLWLDPERDRFEVGMPLPGVELQVVDPTGVPVPPGAEGAVRYRTPGQVDGYLVEGTIELFEDGWFVPGDRGRFENGSLVLSGRDSELINLGGYKLDPVRVDDLALAFAGVRDAAAFALERRPGIPEVGLAVVVDRGCDLRELDRQLRAALPVGHPSAFVRVNEIPRSRLGKPLRAVLSEHFPNG